MMNNANNFGMNQIGINQMGMNPMLMNNMIGNNNQPILMDQTALNIKNIIQPYENKISQLEEIIKQKDFEITVLKQKLNNFMNMNQMMNMKMGPMMNMNMNMGPMMNILPFEKKEEITLNVKNSITNINCFKNEKLSSLKAVNLKITYNYKLLSEEKTLEEYGIIDGSTINITDKIYRLIFRPTRGEKSFIALDGDCPLEQAIIFYCNQFTDNNIYQRVLNGQIAFIYNAMKLNIHDKTPIKSIFFASMNPNIMVNDSNNINGG